MKRYYICRRAALVLLGWYLLYPRVSSHDPTVIDKNLPIRMWKHARSFDSAEVCERTRSALLALARNKVVEPADMSQTERAQVLLKYAAIYASRCIASDDPRLKAN